MTSPEATTTDPRVEHVWLTPKEVAARLRLSLNTVHLHLAAGTMRSVQSCPNGRRYIRPEWADAWGETRPPLPAVLRRRRK